MLGLASGAEYAADLFSHSWHRVSGAEIKGGDIWLGFQKVAVDLRED